MQDRKRGEVDPLTPCSCLCCLPRCWQPRVGNQCTFVLLKDEHSRSQIFDPKLAGKREQRAHWAGETANKEQKALGLVAEGGAKQLE